MPALLKKSLTRSLSKKWNSVTGGGKYSTIKSGNINLDGAKMMLPPAIELNEDIKTPSPYYEGPPQAVVVSDTSSDDDDSSSEDEKDAAEKYGYGDAAPSNTTETTTMPRRLSTRASISTRRRSTIRRQQPLNLSNHGDGNDDDDENLPFHPQRMPRRSSMKGTCPVRAQRRASIGTPAERRMSIEKELAIGAIEESQIFEIKLPMRRESIKRRRSIQFNEDVNVRKIQPTSKVRGAVKKELWFQDDEYSTIKKKTRALLEKVDANGIVNGKKYCTRGLEKYMECPAKRSKGKYEAWDSVLGAQELQRKLRIFDDESLGKFYKQTSTMNVAEAAIRANADAEEVASFYQPPTATEAAPRPVARQVSDDDDDDDDQQQRRNRMSRRSRRASIA